MEPAFQHVTRPGSARALSLEGDVVVKSQSRAASRRERLRTLAGASVGKETGLFSVPDVVAYDDERGEIVFLRLHFDNLPQAIVRNDPRHALQLVRRVARALAAVHGRMVVGQGATRTPPGTLGTRHDRAVVPLHGDFGAANLSFVPGRDQPVLIDWSNADWIGVESDLGVPELDVAVSSISLFHRRPLGPPLMPARHALARAFLATSATDSPAGLDVTRLRTVAHALLPRHWRLTRRLRGPVRALGYGYALLDLSVFLGRLDSGAVSASTHSAEKVSSAR